MPLILLWKYGLSCLDISSIWADCFDSPVFLKESLHAKPYYKIALKSKGLKLGSD